MPGMAFVGSAAEAAICIKQAEYLQAVGGVTRNTFIDFTAKKDASQRRTRSSPPGVCFSDQYIASSGQAVCVDAFLQSSTTLPKRPRWSDADDESLEALGSSASTVCSESEHQRISDVDRTAAGLHAAEDLAALVQEGCGFFRIRSHAIQMESKAGRGKALATIRFFVQGLPWAKRAKWVQPLLWSVTAVLARNGVKATVKGGDLIACLADGRIMRIDFAAARM